jgi:hypothetical protein
MRILKSHPLLKLVNSYLIDASQPSNISYLWNFGSLLAVCLIIQIITGVTLAMHYSPNVLEAFNSIEHELGTGLLFIFFQFFFMCAIFNVGDFTIFSIKNMAIVTFFISQQYIKICNILQTNILQTNQDNQLLFNNELILTPKSSNIPGPRITAEGPAEDVDFYEWFRGLVDGEGCFIISPKKNNSFSFKFDVYMHKDNWPMLKYIANRLGVGRVYVREHFANFTVVSQKDLLTIINIFDKYPLNTSKNLNYLLWKKGYELYYNRKKLGDGLYKDLKNLTEELVNLKNQMNKKRNDFKQSDNHHVYITPYWLLGFVEAEGFFSVVLKDYRLVFGIGQTASEAVVLEAIQKFLLELPALRPRPKDLVLGRKGEYKITRRDSNIVSLTVSNKIKNENSKPMATLATYKTDFITNTLVPFFDNLTWLSNKKLDYEDWKLILNIKNQGKHFTEEGKELIPLLGRGMNRGRLSTNIKEDHLCLTREEIKEKTLKLLSSPSNYDIHDDGKIWIKSLKVYLKGRGNINVKVLDQNNELIYNFISIKECAQFFNVSERTINRKLDKGTTIEFNGKFLTLNRNVSLL